MFLPGPRTRTAHGHFQFRSDSLSRRHPPQLGVVCLAFLRIEQRVARLGDFLEQSAAFFGVGTFFIVHHEEDLLVGRVFDRSRVFLLRRHTEQLIVIRRPLFGLNAEPLRIGIEHLHAPEL